MATALVLTFRSFCFLAAVAKVFVLATPVVSKSGPSSLRWVPASSLSNLSNLIIGGSRDGYSYFVARGRISNTYGARWVPGKSIADHNGFKAYIPFQGKEYTFSDFDVLTAPAGTTSWISSNAIPRHLAVFGGRDPKTIDAIFICQGWYGGYLMIGKAIAYGRGCQVAWGGKEEWSWDRVKILVVN